MNNSQVAGRRSQVAGRGQKMGKRGLISSFLEFFGFTILIALVLIVYVVGGGIIKKIDKSAADVAILDERDVEIDNIFDYSARHVLLNDVEVLVGKGENVDSAIGRARETGLLEGVDVRW